MPATLARALLLAAALLLLVGCPGSSRPIPVVNVVVMAVEDAYRFDGQQVSARQLSEELRRLADHNRRKEGNVRAIVRLSSEPGADYARVRDVEEFCVQVGIVQIEKGR